MHNFLRNLTLIIISVLFFKVGLAMSTSSSNYESEIKKFREKVETRLRSPEGWLAVVGLHWLKEGENTIGSAKENGVILPESVPAHLGAISFSKKKGASIVFATANAGGPNGAVTLNGQPVKVGEKYPLADDDNGKATQDPPRVKVGSVNFFLIERKNGVGIRVKDENAAARKDFQGRKWYAADEKLVVNAEWVAFDKPQKILMPDILGNLNEELSPGYARFELNGQKVELHPVVEDDTLFFVFRDQTSGKETYGAARFLNTPMPKNGHVVLDFNRAVNPPCAFTAHATCPMPPSENIVKVAIRAGELKPVGGDH